MTLPIYRDTTLGVALQESLDIMGRMGFMNARLEAKIFKAFDHIMAIGLEEEPESKISIQGGELLTYTGLNEVYTLYLKDVVISEDNQKVATVDKLKIVALPIQDSDSE